MSTDIDIDLADREYAIATLPCVAATITSGPHRGQRHMSGVYFQDIPVDPITGFSALSREEADRRGYFKIDLLSNLIYEGVRNEAHLDELLATEPDWTLLEEPSIVAMLYHIGEHFGIVQAIRPKSIDDLAIVLALIRPGKSHLRFRSREEIDANIWKIDSDEYSYKRSHAIAFAASIVVQLNLIVEQTAAEMLSQEGDE